MQVIYEIKNGTIHLPVFSSFKTTSDTSKTFSGKGIFLLAAIVFNNPGNKLVLQTWNSRVFGFDMWTAGISSIEWPNFVEISSREHCTKNYFI